MAKNSNKVKKNNIGKFYLDFSQSLASSN